MKSERIIKSLFVAVIALLAILCTIPAFAAETGDITIHLEHMDCEFQMHGEIELGKNTITPDDTYSPCYEFDAEKTGYYLISNFTNEYSSLYPWFAESYNGSEASGFADSLDSYNAKTELYKQLYYLEQGTHLLAVDVNYEALPSSEITIEYFGDEIAEVEYDETRLNFIIGENVSYEDDSVHLNLYPVITMTNGNVFNGESDYNCIIECSFDSAIKKGENNVTLHLPGLKHKTTAYVYEISDIIESIEFSNTEKCTEIYEYYNLRYGYHTPVKHGESIKITYTDGSTETVTANEENSGNYSIFITLPCKVKSYIYFDYMKYSDGSVYFIGSIADKEFIKEKCTPKEVALNNNIDYFKSNVEEIVTDLIADLYEIWFNTVGNSAEGTMVYTINRIVSFNKEIVKEFSTLVNYYI